MYGLINEVIYALNIYVTSLTLIIASLIKKQNPYLIVYAGFIIHFCITFWSHSKYLIL